MNYTAWKCVRTSNCYHRNKKCPSELLSFGMIDVFLILIMTALSIKIYVSKANEFHPLAIARSGIWRKSYINQSCHRNWSLAVDKIFTRMRKVGYIWILSDLIIWPPKAYPFKRYWARGRYVFSWPAHPILVPFSKSGTWYPTIIKETKSLPIAKFNCS